MTLNTIATSNNAPHLWWLTLEPPIWTRGRLHMDLQQIFAKMETKCKMHEEINNNFLYHVIYVFFI